MRRLPTLVTLLLAFASGPSHAECECLWQGSFADVVGETDLVVAATVAEIKGNSVDIDVEESLKGEAYLDRIRVWMRTKDYCRPETDEFELGSRWVFALYRIREVPEGGFDSATPNYSYGRPDDYYLSECGGYWLDYSGEVVTGNLVDGPRWAREVEMTPVQLDLVKAYLRGTADQDALRSAAEEDPAVLDLMLDTKAFLRGDEDL